MRTGNGRRTEILRPELHLEEKQGGNKASVPKTDKKHWRGQSAIEFIMTYGWALLILAIVIALIFSSGIFSPGYLISEECNLGQRLPCRLFLSSTEGSGTVDMEINNGFGYTITITDVKINNEIYGELTVTGPPQRLESGEAISLQGSLPQALGKGSNQRFRVQVEYYSCAPEVNPDCNEPSDEAALHTISGRIIGKVN